MTRTPVVYPVDRCSRDHSCVRCRSVDVDRVAYSCISDVRLREVSHGGGGGLLLSLRDMRCDRRAKHQKISEPRAWRVLVSSFTSNVHKQHQENQASRRASALQDFAGRVLSAQEMYIAFHARRYRACPTSVHFPDQTRPDQQKLCPRWRMSREGAGETPRLHMFIVGGPWAGRARGDRLACMWLEVMEVVLHSAGIRSLREQGYVGLVFGPERPTF